MRTKGPDLCGDGAGREMMPYYKKMFFKLLTLKLS
jgi:hypothetical protein